MRRTNEEINAEIVDAAAGLFAVHSFERTSVQQIADAVGYSKTGLLHRFPSKLALLDAVDQLIDQAIGAIQEYGATLPPNADGPLQLLTMITETALSYPGLVQFLIQSLHQVEPGTSSPAARVKMSGDRIIEAVSGSAFAGHELSAERRMRVVLALELICSGVVAGRHPEHQGMGNDLGPLLIKLAGQVIGHDPVDRVAVEPADIQSTSTSTGTINLGDTDA